MSYDNSTSLLIPPVAAAEGITCDFVACKPWHAEAYRIDYETASDSLTYNHLFTSVQYKLYQNTEHFDVLQLIKKEEKRNKQINKERTVEIQAVISRLHVTLDSLEC